MDNYVIDLKDKIKKLEINKENLNINEYELGKKEKEINEKIAFLEDKENYIDKANKQFQKDIEENIKIKKENKELIQKNKELENEIKQRQIINSNLIKQNSQPNILVNNINNSPIKYNNENQSPNAKSKIKNINIKEPIDKIIKEPILLYKNPTLIGLNNIGATCFMNSTLQCLSQTKALTNFFLKNNNRNRIINNNIAKINKNSYQLSPVYLELIQKLWDKNGPKSFSPYNFMNTVNEMNPLFKKGQAGDSKDFIIFVLEQLHKELKNPVHFNKIIKKQPLNQYDKNNAFNNFFSEFKEECSIISDIFFGFTETTNECLNCKNVYNNMGFNNPICYNYGIFNCLIFPLEEVKNMKNNNIQFNNFFQMNNNRVSIYECFYYNQNSEYFTGENKNYCNICNQLYDSIYTSRIFVSPNVLVLILNRGKGNIYDVKLDFYEKIDISKFILQKEVPQIIYNLYGVITHIGESGPNAHFIASCKSPINNRWYRYNDAIVSPITNIQKEVIEFGTPYILFYQKMNNQ